MRLERRIVLITGAGSGIGRALAIGAARNGATVILAGRRAPPLEAASQEIGPNRAVVHPCDIRSAAERAALFAMINRRFGGLDLLVNNAGICHATALCDSSAARIEELISTNLTAPIALCAVMIPLLERRAPHSRIVNVGSMFGDIPYPLYAAYSASKCGLRGFSDALRRELAPAGIGVLYAAPRATDTPALAAQAHLIEPFEMRVDSPDRAAERIIMAVTRDLDAIYPGAAERFFVVMQRLFPKLVDRVVARQLARVRQAQGQQTAA